MIVNNTNKPLFLYNCKNWFIFFIEWYSTGVYYITETVSDFIVHITGASICATIAFFGSYQLNEDNRFWKYFFSYQLLFHTISAFGHTLAIIFFKFKELCFFFGILYAMFNTLLTVFFIKPNDLSDFIEGMTNISILRFVSEMTLMSVLAFGRCPPDTVSKHLIIFELTDDDKYWDNMWCVLEQFATFKVIGLIWLILINNSNWFRIPNFKVAKRLGLRRNVRDSQIELIRISTITTEYYSYDNSNPVDYVEETDTSTSDGYQSNDGNSLEWVQTSEELNSKQVSSIAWIDLTLRVGKSLFSDEKLILRKIKGFAKFGSLTALMGPTGAGKTALLKCLNGKNRHLMTRDSKIYSSKSRKIRTCFIAQDQREHLIEGLTVKQSLFYASKLKNTGKRVDHKFNINELMNELSITDIRNVKIEKCSFGQQKRVVMAMELTSKTKPNLICVDEPTSGADNYSALLVSISFDFNFFFIKRISSIDYQ